MEERSTVKETKSMENPIGFKLGDGKTLKTEHTVKKEITGRISILMYRRNNKDDKNEIFELKLKD
jgi:hypothetical protein